MNFNEKKRLAEEVARTQFPGAYEMMKMMGAFDQKIRGFEVLEQYKHSMNLPVQIPQRATSKSAGYDIRANEEVFIMPGEMKAIGTGLTVYMQDDEFLDLRIRSGLAFKYQLTLQNDAGVVDADYYGKEIKVMIRNEGTQVARFVQGDRIAQGIFTPYLVTDDDAPADKERDGGFGSTGVR